MYWLLVLGCSILSFGSLFAQPPEHDLGLDRDTNNQYISLDWVCRAHAIADYREGKKAKEAANYSRSIEFYEKALQKLTYSYYLDTSSAEINPPYLPQISDLSNLKLSTKILDAQIDNYEQEQQWIFAQVIAQYNLALVQRSFELNTNLDSKIVQNAYERLIHVEIVLYQKTSAKYYLEQAIFHIEQHRQYILYQQLFGEFKTKNRDLEKLVKEIERLGQNYRNEGLIQLQDYCIKKNQQVYNCNHNRKLYHLSNWIELLPKTAVLTEIIANKKKIELQLSDLKDSLQKHHPRYYNLHYTALFTNTQEIQKRLPHRNAMLSLWKNNNQLYRFVITRDTIQFDAVDWDSLQENWVEDLKKVINRTSIEELNIKPNRYFIQSAHQLYKHLFDFLEQEHFADLEELLIIASDDFLTVPFDLCLTENDTSNSSWQNLSYLTHKIAVYRAHSAVWWQKIPSRAAPTNAHSLLHLDFFQNMDLSTSFLTNIHYSDEITEAFLNRKVNQNQYSALHLSAFYDDSASLDEKPYIIFNRREGNKLKLTEQLHTYQLRSMNARVNIFALELRPERNHLPMTNMVKNLQYVGHPSVILFDPSSSYITSNFYNNLTLWDSKSVALQRAKINYLIIDHADELYYHPYFWESNYLYGDTSIIRLQRRVMIINNWGLLGLCVLTLIVGFFAYKKWRILKKEELIFPNG